MTIRLFVVLALMILSLGARADWLLNNHRSELTFVSTKAIDIAEVHRFDSLAGRIEDNGKAVVTIDLASVDTGIDIRDE